MWNKVAGYQGSVLDSPSIFCPSITTVREARIFGISYVLEPHGSPGPPGTVLESRIGYEELSPGARCRLRDHHTPAGEGAPADRCNRYARSTSAIRNPAAWRMTTESTAPQAFRLRVTNVPGWHATIDGKPLTLEPYADVMLQARIPAGRHVVELDYWPTTFTLGIVIAALSALFLVVAVVAERLRPDLFAGVRRRGAG